MPYGSRKLPNGKVEVYKLDTGKKVGITSASMLPRYMAALHANEPKKMSDGGLVSPSEDVIDPEAKKKFEEGFNPQQEPTPSPSETPTLDTTTSQGNEILKSLSNPRNEQDEQELLEELRKLRK